MNPKHPPGPPMTLGNMRELRIANWLKDWARVIERDVHALYLASRDPRVPWYAKATAMVVTGYALSPIDLIPDFIPVVGYLDDVILVPLGILLVILDTIPSQKCRKIPGQLSAGLREPCASSRSARASTTIPAIG